MGIRDRKAEVIESTRRKREERRLKQLRLDSSTRIQRVFRGYSCRRHQLQSLVVLQQQRQQLDKLQEQPSQPHRDYPAAIISVLLSLIMLHKKEDRALEKTVLLRHSVSPPPVDSISRVGRERIIKAALRQLRCPTSNNATELLTLHALVRTTNRLTKDTTGGVVAGAMPVFRMLVETCQHWLVVQRTNTASHVQEIASSLWGMVCQSSQILKNQSGLALVAFTLFAFSGSTAAFQEMIGVTYTGHDSGLTWAFQDLLPALVDSLGSQKTALMLKGHEIQLLDTILQSSKLFHGQTSPSPHAKIQLVQHIVSTSTEISVLAAMFIRGENVRASVLEGKDGTTNATTIKINDSDDDDDDDDDDDVDMDDHDGENTNDNSVDAGNDGRDEETVPGNMRHPENTNRVVPQGQMGASSLSSFSPSTVPRKRSKPRSTATRLTRQTLQTMPRLNRLYRVDFAMLRQQTLDNIQRRSFTEREALVRLAELLGDASLWIEWGNAVLGQESVSCKSYLWLLGRMLQGCSGLRTTTTSPFMSRLAFQRTLLEKLWRQVLVLSFNGGDEKDTGLVCNIVFCDLFAHHLIALSDQDFLRLYTTSQGTPTVVAEHVIKQLREILYELYWIRPVQANDVRVALGTDNDALRARLMLSGTKLWNSLYERWCRLVHQSPFCDESSWLFPRLAARDDRGAVVGSRESPAPEPVDELGLPRRHAHNRMDTPNGTDDNADEDDDDSAADEMEVDETDRDRQNNARETESDALADIFRDPKMARVLSSIPQALPFTRRVKLFDALLSADKLKTQDEAAEFQAALRRMMQRGEDADDIGQLNMREKVEIRRDVLYGDSIETLNQLGTRLKRKVQVTFINQHGMQEAGIDGGGVFKEFLDDLIKVAFDPNTSEDIPKLFTVTPMDTLAVNVDLPPAQETLRHYEFLGRVLGKAMYESILVEPQFCLPFLNQLLGKQNALEDLKNMDAEYYSNLVKLKTLSVDEIANLGLTFELTLGPNRTVPLLPGGSRMQVTKENVIHYVHLVAHQRLNIEGAPQTRAFLQGFRDLIPASWVRLFSAYELQKLVSGDDTVRGIDVANLKSAIVYQGGYHSSQPFVQMFWEVVEEMTPGQQKKLLRFMTSCSRQPLLGFQALDPAPAIQQIRLPDALLLSEKDVPLPTSSTCMNLLKLPNYRSKDLLKRKLLASIEAGAGFELS